MHQVFSELKLINLNSKEIKIFSSGSISDKDEMQIDEEQTDEIQQDEMQINENVIIKLNWNYFFNKSDNDVFNLKIILIIIIIK